ncbi:hypothetical protein ACWGCW_07280 [Streptomyces sp. NPDC054933]
MQVSSFFASRVPCDHVTARLAGMPGISFKIFSALHLFGAADASVLVVGVFGTGEPVSVAG